jgi:hypothetical protein
MVMLLNSVFATTVQYQNFASHSVKSCAVHERISTVIN